MLSLSSMFDLDGAGDLCVAVDLRLPDGDFALRVEDGRLTVEPGRNPQPDCVVTGDQNALLSVLYAGQTVGAAVAEGSLEVEGRSEALTRLGTVPINRIPCGCRL